MPIKINYKKISLPFRHPFTISKGTKTHQPSLLVELDFFGLKGYGEAPAIAYYHISVDKMVEDLEAKRAILEKFAFSDPDRFWHFLHHLFPQNQFLVCALDMAGWDLYGKLKKTPLYKLWGLSLENLPITDYTIGFDSVEKMQEKIKEKAWPVYKIKMGFQDDIERLTALRSMTDARFRVDANEGWSLEEAMEKIPVLKNLNVELVEQPLHKTQKEAMQALFEWSELPLFADESCVYEQDVQDCVGKFHGINIKLTKCGGITPALRMIREARISGLKLMLGCMNESTIGSAAIAQLSPFVDVVDMDGPLLLAEDVAAGIDFNYGKFTVPEGFGLGIHTKIFES